MNSITKTKKKFDEAVIDIKSSSVAEVEEILNYRFRNKTLLADALTQSSNYQRLEFLGDAALSLAVSSFIFITYPNLGPRQFYQLHIANLSTEKFARVAIRRGLYRYIRRKKMKEELIRDFALMVQEEENQVVDAGVVKPPKVLADIVESFAGAIYVDCEFDLKLLWKYFGGLLEPLVTVETLQHPVVIELYKLYQREKKRVDIKHSREGSLNIASVYVNGQLVCSGCSKHENIAKFKAANEALKLWEPVSFPVDVDVARSIGRDAPEILHADQKLRNLFRKKRWQRPTYKVKDVGPSYDRRRFICSVQIETVAGSYLTSGRAKPRPKDAKNSAASMLLYGLQDSENMTIEEKLEKNRNKLVETKKRKKETGSEVSAEKVKGDMAIEEKLEKKSNKLVGTKKRKMENGSEVSADKVKVDIAINEKLEKERNKLVGTKKTNQENGSDVSAGKGEQLFAEDSEKVVMDIRLSSVAEVEEILGYRFRNKTLLEEALTHSSYTASLSPSNYERLGLVGGAALGLAVANFLFITYPNFEPDQLSRLREANVNTEKLARVAIRHGFYKYLRHKAPLFDAEVRDFALAVQEEGNGVVYCGAVKALVILAEIVKSIAAAILVDCEFDFKLLWKYLYGLLEPLVTIETFQLPPVSMLYYLCRKEGKHIDIKVSRIECQYTVSFYVNRQLVGSGCSKHKDIAKVTAAREALKLWNLDSSPMNVDVGSATVNDVPEIDGGKQ